MGCNFPSPNNRSFILDDVSGHRQAVSWIHGVYWFHQVSYRSLKTKGTCINPALLETIMNEVLCQVKFATAKSEIYLIAGTMMFLSGRMGQAHVKLF